MLLFIPREKKKKRRRVIVATLSDDARGRKRTRSHGSSSVIGEDGKEAVVTFCHARERERHEIRRR